MNSPISKNKHSNARAYILLEAIIGGALVGTVLIGLFANIGDARAESTRQARELTAEQFALRELEAVRALPYAAVASVAPRTVAIPGGAGKYQLTRTVAAEVVEQVKTSTVIDVRFRTVTVTVAFPDRVGTRSISAATRVYRE